MSSTTRENLLSFLNYIGKDTPESISEAIKLLEKYPEIGSLYADQSPKFVEIFNSLGNTETAIGLFKVISMLFDCCFKNQSVYFGQLHYLADQIIRRHIPELFTFMSRKRNKLAMTLLLQSAKVHHTHCRELFSTLDFSNNIFRKQSKHDSGARDEYVKLATVFLQNSEVAPSFMGTKYYLASIWKELKDDDPETMRNFLMALLETLPKVNLSTRCWVFSDITLKNISQFPLEKSVDKKDPKSLVYDILEQQINGEDSIILEDPSRTYCISIPNIDPPPKNLNFLNFIRELDPWKKPGHRETALMIFKKSPDLISHYFTRQNNAITADITLANLSSLYFINNVIDLEWPSFLYNMNDFFKEERQLDLLFESILPSLLDITKLTTIIEKQKSVLMTKAVLVLLTSAAKKFRKLPNFLKTPQAYTKFNSKIPNLNTVLQSKSPIVILFCLKLLIELDNTIPFFIQDNQTQTLTNLVKNIKKQEPLIQLELIRISTHLQKPSSFLQALSDVILDDSVNHILRQECLKQVIQIVSQTIAFDNHEKECCLWVAYCLRTKQIQQLSERINDVNQRVEKYANGGIGSLLCNAVISKSLEENLETVARFYGTSIKDLVQDSSKITTKKHKQSLSNIIQELQWYSVSETIVKLASLELNKETIALIKALVIICPDQTIDIVLHSSKLREHLFTGENEEIDDLFALTIELNNKTIDDDLTLQFINGTCSKAVCERISPLIDRKLDPQLIGKLLKLKIDIRPIISLNKQDNDLNTSSFDAFWTWVYEDFHPIDLDILRAVSDHNLHKIREETLMLDILRTIYLKEDEELLHRLKLRPTENERIHALLAKMIPDIELPLNIATCFVLNLDIPDPISAFENTKYEWALEFLIRQIGKKPFDHEISRMRSERAQYVLKVFMEDYSETIYRTFSGRLLNYIVRHPDKVTVTPTEIVELYTKAAPKVMDPDQLVNYTVEELKGVCNILNGADVFVSMRTFLYLSVHLSDYDPFYQLIEVQELNPEAILFVTGEASRFAIQQIVSKQQIYPSSLSRNVSYLQPFHMSHTLETDTARFRFLLNFANYLLVNRIIPCDLFMESGAISIVLRGLSSESIEDREMAYDSLSELYYENDEKEWSKQNTVKIFLETLVKATNEKDMRYSHLQTHFLAAFASVLMKPSHNLYMRVVKYITDAPSLRLNQVPLFDAVFDKPTIQYRQERNYILKMLSKGIKEKEDLAILHHGKVCERLMHVFSSPLSDMVTRKQIIDILARVASIDRLEGLLGWILSVLPEFFSLPHTAALVQLALTASGKNEVDKAALNRICKLALSNPQICSTLQKEDREEAEQIIKQK